MTEQTTIYSSDINQASQLESQNDLGSMVQEGSELLLYTLRYDAQDLFDTEGHVELFDLAKDIEFFHAQAEYCPDELNLPLQTVQLAVKYAAKLDDPVAMCEFMFLHRKRLQEINQENPLSTLRKGQLRRAQELAELSNLAHPDARVLWHLLLIWELNANDRVKDISQVLDKLSEKPLTPLSASNAEFGAWLLAQMPVRTEIE